MKDGLWTARLEVQLAPEITLDEDISWPGEFSTPPAHSLFEDPDRGIFSCEVYLDHKPSDKQIRALEAALGAYLKSPGLTLKFKKCKTADWVKKSLAGLKPVEAGRFFIHGGHDADKVPKGKIPILIEASLAFGTGHHETTRGCLEALEGLAETRPKVILDLGAGSGILAIAAAHLWPGAEVIASDNDPEAAAKARENVLANKTPGIKVVAAEGFRARLLKGKSFDLVIANILAGPLIDLAPDIRAHSASGGVVILSGILEAQKAEVLEAYKAQGFSLSAEREENGWPTVTLKA